MKEKSKSQQRRDTLQQAGLCDKCGACPPEDNKRKCTECLRYFVEYNKSKYTDVISPWMKEYRKKIRIEVISKYGGTCNCCGEHRIEFLGIDHKNNDGNEERRALYGRNNCGHVFYLKLRRESVRDDLQVLCHNCNLSKGFYGYCPHEHETKE
jgi:5-methylcytosine-specific restriction endonuclease McrA